MRRLLALFSVVIAATVSLIAPWPEVYAQEPSSSATEEEPKLPTYAEALNTIAWDANRFGPLIAPVTETPLREAPRDYGATLPKSKIVPLVTARNNSGYRPESVAAHYDKGVRRFGGVTAFGPAVQVEYRSRISEHPDTTANGNRIDLTRHLLATLNDAQWRQITSKAGLSADGLSAPQRALWEKIVPRPFAFTHVSLTRPENPLPRPEPGVIEISNFGRNASPPVRLNENMRAQVRLRIKWQSWVEANRAGNKSRYIAVFQKNLNERYLPHLELEWRPQEKTPDTQYGVELVRRLPAHPKPSDLPPDATDRTWDAPVSLAPAEPTKPLTAETLVGRIATATGREIYADRRIGTRIVVTRGDTARAGDALTALAFGLSGAVRRLGPDATGRYAYVLTRDREPLGAEHARIDDWTLDGARMDYSDRETENQRIAQHNPLPLLSFDADDPVALTPTQLSRYLALCRTPYLNVSQTLVEIPLKELTAEQRHMLQDEPFMLGRNTPFGEDPYAPLAHAWARGYISLGFVVPGEGEITSDPLESEPSNWATLDPEVTSDPLAGRTLALRAATTQEAMEAVAAAKESGVAALWLETEPDSLAAAVKAGKAVGVPVAAIVRLLTRAIPGVTPDINIFGEDSAAYAKRRWNRTEAPLWYAPDDPAAHTAALERLRRTAAVPGIAAVVIRDALPPGYRAAKTAEPYGRPGEIPPYQDGAAAQLGYSSAHRIAFLRAKTLDPADIILSASLLASIAQYGEAAPYERNQTLFGVGGAAADDWAVWRREIAQSLLADARTTVRNTAPDLPLVLTGYTTWRYSTSLHNFSADWFITWPDSLQDAPDLFRLASVDATQFRPRAARTTPADARSKEAPPLPGVKIWLGLGGPDTSLSPAAMVKQAGDGWDGFVYDLSYLPWPEAKKRLAPK